MEIQDKVESVEENSSAEDAADDDAENRIYNGFQGPLTEGGNEEDVRPSAGSSSTRIVPVCTLLLFSLLL